MFENYGFAGLVEDEEFYPQLLNYLINTGKEKRGYLDHQYFYNELGNLEVWVKTRMMEDGTLDVLGTDTHCGNPCVWDLVYTGIDITPECYA